MVSGPAKILAVDDEADFEQLIRQRFRRQIRAHEFDFRFAQHGEEALAVLERIGFLDRIGGGAWDRERQRRKPVVWRLGWAARNPPTEGLRPERLGSGGNDAPRPSVPVLGPLSGLRGGFLVLGNLPSGGELAAMRQAARAALDRLRAGPPLPALSAAALTTGRRTMSPHPSSHCAR